MGVLKNQERQARQGHNKGKGYNKGKLHNKGKGSSNN